MTRLLGCLALQIGWRNECRVRPEGVQLCSEEGMLFCEVVFERLEMRESVSEVLRGRGVQYERVGDRLRIGGGCIERHCR